MFMNIFVVIMIIVVIAAGAFGWWIDNGKSRKDTSEKKDTSK